MSSPAPNSPDAEKPPLRCQYKGMNVYDCRDRIQIVIGGELPPGASAGLRTEGFRKRSAGVWEAPHSPMAIAAAQAIGNIFFSEER